MASHNISLIISLVKRPFEDFWDFLSTAVLQWPESFKTACDLIYHKNWFCQTQFLIFFDFFISLFCCLLNPGGAKRDIIYHPKLICQMILSKKTQKIAIFLQFLRPTRKRVCAVCVRVCRQAFLCFGWQLRRANRGGWRKAGNYGNCGNCENYGK